MSQNTQQQQQQQAQEIAVLLRQSAIPLVLAVHQSSENQTEREAMCASQPKAGIGL